MAGAPPGRVVRGAVPTALTTGHRHPTDSDKLLLCNNLNDALTYVPFFIFRCCEPVVLYIILLEKPASCHVFVKWPVGKK